MPPSPWSRSRSGATAVALLIIPERATEFWPWPVDAFHARIYAAAYLAPAVGAWVLRSGATPEELRTLGITLVTMSVAAIVAVPTNTAFLLINVAPILAGAALLLGARAHEPSGGLTRPSWATRVKGPRVRVE